MDFLVMQTFNGLSYAAILFLLASGLTLILGVMKIVNIAHGSFYLVGGYIGYLIASRTQNFYFALFTACIVIAFLGAVIERFLLRKLADQTLRQVLVTAGVAFFLQDLCFVIWGGNPLTLDVPAYLSHVVTVGGFPFSVLRIVMIGISAALYAGLWWFQEKTRAGAILRASVDNGEIAQGLGINVPVVKFAVFALGASIAGLGGVIGCAFMAIYPGLDFELLPYPFVVVILGGLGSLKGALVGAVAVGLIDNFGKALFPELAYFTLFLPMALVLALRPTGLYGKR